MKKSKDFKLIKDFIVNSNKDDFMIITDSEVDHADKVKLVELIKPAIGIQTTSIEPDVAKIGKSRIGGRPDLPQEYEWPVFEQTPLVFCAQYNLSEAANFDEERILPSQGMLYVFFNLNKEQDSFSDQDNEHRIFYVDDISRLERKEFPSSFEENKKIASAEITFSQMYTLPDDENYKLFPFNEKYKEVFSYLYDEVDTFICEEIYPESGMHQLLGEDRSIQSSVVYDFAVKELKISYEEYKEKYNIILEAARNYRILIQLDCFDSNTNLCNFGGSGVIYIGLKQEDLERKIFTNLTVSFQMT